MGDTLSSLFFQDDHQTFESEAKGGLAKCEGVSEFECLTINFYLVARPYRAQ